MLDDAVEGRRTRERERAGVCRRPRRPRRPRRRPTRPTLARSIGHCAHTRTRSQLQSLYSKGPAPAASVALSFSPPNSVALPHPTCEPRHVGSTSPPRPQRTPRSCTSKSVSRGEQAATAHAPASHRAGGGSASEPWPLARRRRAKHAPRRPLSRRTSPLRRLAATLASSPRPPQFQASLRCVSSLVLPRLAPLPARSAVRPQAPLVVGISLEPTATGIRCVS